MTRTTFNWVFGGLGALIGAISLGIGLCVSLKFGPPHLKAWGPFVIGIWILVPPIFFWMDWVCFASELKTDELRDFAKHTHDLSRNIWIALAAILAYLFGVPLLGHQ
jgi:hypothetical protein